MEAKSKFYYDNCRNKECENECDDDCAIPAYYLGKYGMMAKDVIWEFDLSYNLGTAVSYLLRCQKKHDNPTNCIKKAIAHLEFELDNLQNES